MPWPIVTRAPGYAIDLAAGQLDLERFEALTAQARERPSEAAELLREALALFTATQLPLVVAITTVAVESGHMRSSTAAALVGAGALSTLAGPLHGLRVRRIAAEMRAAEVEVPA